MLRLTFPVRHPRRNGIASHIAMAIALAGAGVLGTAALEVPAQAQSAKPKYTEGFEAAYTPFNTIVNTAGSDLGSAKAMVPGVVGAAQSADDRFAAGDVILQLGIKTEDPVLQRQGLELMLSSGVLAPEKVGQFQYFVGGLAYDAQDWEASRTAYKAALDAGYTQGNPQDRIVQSYFQQGAMDQGIAYIETAAQAGPVPETWLLRGLKAAYDSKNVAASNKLAALLVEQSPTQKNWQTALQVIGALNNLGPQEQLDLLRLMRLTNSMSERREFTSYIEAADPRSMSNEVLGVLSEGVSAGVFNSSDAYYTEVKGIADSRSATDKSDASSVGAASSASATSAQANGDLLYSVGDYAKAEQMYAAAVEKGPRDRNEALTRLGIAQVRQGKNAEAKATFQQVSGNRAPIAAMWIAYVETKGA